MQKSEFYANARDDLDGPLHGVAVLEATTTWAGPTAACVLADFGAKAELQEYPLGHFDIYQGDGFRMAVADQTEFFTRHMLGGSLGVQNLNPERPP
ncbi:MAG: CoA transferase [Pseudomonadales bacterium]|jgi:crotonobetainyl-CoA:carnitine CoA-transferase CaiB-like acyl-CoA transferase|nr:CoA transferase [Pseudomonadales bacterium]MDP6470153.1 CoA transferase [Pseudomonadales bacterium]MDP6827059.1 CoA transferase [Pseudomonadales bacterium]MDP6972584.1 CoA transferase [Pseudomonadales bacterium]|tara:strand:+ start:2072 stop:2359 length:288 start_codon:yes stop_codon:yes gene_type:complete